MGASPAFSFYAKDFLAGTATMSLQEVGAYIRLLSYEWDAGSVPAEPNERACVLGCAKAQERELWKKVGKKFVLRGDVYINERLEQERQKQLTRRQRLSDNGKLGGRPPKATENQEAKQDESKSFPVAKAEDNQNERLAFSSSSSTPDSSKNDESGGRTRPQTLIPRGQVAKWGNRHSDHLAGFCDWVCFDMAQVDEFAGRIPGDDIGLKRQQIKEWASAIRALWADRIIPDGSHFDFWRNRWTEQHGGSRPANATLKATRAAADLDEAFK